MINNSRQIINGWIRSSEKPSNRYNEGLRRAVSDWSGIEAADSRDGSDTGMEMERLPDNSK